MEIIGFSKFCGAGEGIQNGIDDGKEYSDRTGIVIVVSGFGVMNATMALDRQLERGLRAEVTLIIRNNFFLFTPSWQARRRKGPAGTRSHFLRHQPNVAGDP